LKKALNPNDMPVNTLRFRKRQLQKHRLRFCFRLLLCCIGLQIGALLFGGLFIVSVLDIVGGKEHGKGNQPWVGGPNIRGQQKASSQHHEGRASALPQQQESLQNDDSPPIDDYYARTTSRRKHQQPLPPVPLVVGGSDGSGTRAFVVVLERLGVPMIVDDHGTMDMHGKQLYNGQGWPPLANRVLAMMQNDQSNRSTTLLNLTLDEIPQEVRTNLVSLREELERRQSVARRKLELKMKGSSQKSPFAQDVTYGFKAPITMLLLPLLQAFMYPPDNTPGFKYLHIVRDGRDVALSNNQSPVKKFYERAYASTFEERVRKFRNVSPVFGMQLWNDWNVNLYAWEQQQQSRIPTADNAASSFDYLVVRTEDLLLTTQSKFETLLRLADFVGSSKTPEELCCMSRETAKDLGLSNVGKSKRATKKINTGKKIMSYDELMNGSPKTADTKTKEGELEDERHIHDQPVDRHGRRRLTLIANNTATTESFSSHHEDHTSNTLQHDVANNLDENYSEPNLEDTVALPRRRLFGWFETLFLQNNPGTLVTTQVKQLLQQHSSAPAGVSDRYGKWQHMLKSEPTLSKALQEQGATALKMFGYEPPRQFMDRSPDDAFVCDERVECSDY
jgi:hypothetical protein